MQRRAVPGNTRPIDFKLDEKTATIGVYTRYACRTTARENFSSTQSRNVSREEKYNTLPRRWAATGHDRLAATGSLADGGHVATPTGSVAGPLTGGLQLDWSRAVIDSRRPIKAGIHHFGSCSKWVHSGLAACPEAAQPAGSLPAGTPGECSTPAVPGNSPAGGSRRA
jgi:hypothetical protein